MLAQCECASGPRPNLYPVVPPWKDDPAFGMIHPSGCTICTSYMKHLAAASQPDADGLSLAVKNRDSEATLCYLRGVSEGIRLCGDDYLPETAAKYRAEYDDVVEMLNLRAVQLAAAEKELIQVREQFQTLQLLFEQVMCISEDVLPPARMKNTEHSSLYEPVNVEVENVEFVARDDLCAGTIHASLPTPSPSPPPQSGCVLPLSSALPSPAIVLGQSAEHSKPATPTASYSLHELAALISEARTCSGKAREIVEALYRVAESTCESDLIPAQQLVLLEWTPLCLRSGCSDTSLTTPSLTPEPFTSVPRRSSSKSNQIPIEDCGIFPPAEIYVDSSGWGIGFSLNGLWLAWKLRPGWNVNGRDNNWAEMVAVELGLLVFISSGLYLRNSRAVTVRSDNSGVVKSLFKGKTKHPTQPQVIQRIQGMVRQYRLSFDVRWVPTKENIADRISRGDLPPRSLRYPVVSSVVPEYLKPFLCDTV